MITSIFRPAYPRTFQCIYKHSGVRTWNRIRLAHPPIPTYRVFHASTKPLTSLPALPHRDIAAPADVIQNTSKTPGHWALPATCRGCGAYTQFLYPHEPGFYTSTRKPVKHYINQVERSNEKELGEDNAAVQNPGVDTTQSTTGASKPKEYPDVEPPICDRCHNLVHSREGEPIAYPSVSYIRDLIEESPFPNNYIYHILDAADFPLSLIRNLPKYIPLQPQRSRNRRSQTKQYSSSRQLAELNFIITRADLLTNNKDEADSLMNEMVGILRESLDPKSHGIRLGNVHMVSSHRGWWTKSIKQDIWERGGGVWMVGKANVGKSKLIPSIFPKTAPSPRPRSYGSRPGVTIIGRLSSSKENTPPEISSLEDRPSCGSEIDAEDLDVENMTLLPPLQTEVPFPSFPIDSSLPGTTASPIRIPFDNHRGEVIDLPGLQRSGLADYVKDEFKSDLVMTSRPRPQRYTIKPQQTLLLGGLIGITPHNSENIILAAPFVSLKPHITANHKATEMLAQKRECPVGNIAKEGIGEEYGSEVIELKWDVTQKYAKSPSSKDILPLYKIFGVDVLVEGCGWVELTAEVRTRHWTPGEFPKVEVFSPMGKFIGSRKPLATYSFNLQHRAAEFRKRITKRSRT